MAPRPLDIAVITFNSIPRLNHTLKYERLGTMALENRRIYCERHGYRFIDQVAPVPDRPACWAKIPALLAAFTHHEWALWADSDALVMNMDRRLEDYCDPEYDLIVESPERFFRHVGIDPAVGLQRMPINTGVFMVRRTAWLVSLLNESYQQVDLITNEEPWNGVGEQEAMTRVLRRRPDARQHVGYVQGLQNHPKLYTGTDLFLHFYGNHAKHRVGAADCEEVLGAWQDANRKGGPFPPDLARFHWCCIQNKRPDRAYDNDLSHYLYTAADLEAAGTWPN